MNEYNSELGEMLIRLRDEHKWNWGLIRGFVNRQFHVSLDQPTLKELYRQAKCKQESLRKQSW